MKRSAILVLLILTAVIALTLSACSQGEAESSGTITTEQASEQADTQAPVHGSNGSGFAEGELEFELQPDNSYGVRMSAEFKSSNVTLPSVHNGAPVSCILPEGFAGCDTLKYLEIPGSIKSIGYRAFNRCRSLWKVTLNEGVISMDHCAFQACHALNSVTLPNSLREIGTDAFDLCDRLFGEEHENCIYLGNSDNKYLYLFRVIDKNAASVNIHPSTRFIGDAAMWSCKQLTGITIPPSVTSIGSGAFADCVSLRSIVIPDTVKILMSTVFNRCSSLESVTLSSSITKLYPQTFQNCTALESIVLHDAITWIGTQQFNGCTSLREATLPIGITDLDSSWFRGCTALERLVFKGSVADWTALPKLDNWMSYLPEGCIIQCTDGNVTVDRQN